MANNFMEVKKISSAKNSGVQFKVSYLAQTDGTVMDSVASPALGKIRGEHLQPNDYRVHTEAGTMQVHRAHCMIHTITEQCTWDTVVAPSEPGGDTRLNMWRAA